MKTLLFSALALGLAAPPANAAEPGWDPRKAAARLDERADFWLKTDTAQRATDAAGKTACLSCHTTVHYALARPFLANTSAVNAAIPLDRIVKDVDRRLVAGPAAAELYAFSPAKKKESRGTEAVLSALVLAWGDAARGEAAPTAATRRAVDRLWEAQRADGGWDWLRFDLEPWESAAAEYHGATLAAVAVGTALGYRALDANPAIEKKVDALRSYLASKRDRKRLDAEAWLLFASTRLSGLLTKAERAEIVAVLRAKQHTFGDAAGGWVLLELASGQADATASSRKLSPAARTPDGYATGLVTYAFLQSGASADDPAVVAGVRWLKRNQQADGSWPAASINKVRAPGEFAEPFMSDAATAWAVLALQAADRAAK